MNPGRELDFAMEHPAQADLALFAGGDLGFLSRLRVAIHVRSCDRCREELDAFRDASAQLRTHMEDLPADLDWERLADEMTGNIHVGLEAGECVGRVPVRSGVKMWRAGVVMAGMTILLMAAWWLNVPVNRSKHAIRASSAVEIRATSAGIELQENGNALTLMHVRSGEKPLVVSAPGMLRSRYVDAETGQMTINNVYAD